MSGRYLPLVLIGSVVWTVWSLLVGYLVNRLPERALASDRGILRLLPWERDRRGYERWWRIKAWKDRTPEAGALFPGGMSKRHLVGRDPAYLGAFVVATRRAELTHWLGLALSPVFFLWNPWWLAAAFAAYGVVGNVPCIVIQRYNRARLERVLSTTVTG